MLYKLSVSQQQYSFKCKCFLAHFMVLFFIATPNMLQANKSNTTIWLNLSSDNYNFPKNYNYPILNNTLGIQTSKQYKKVNGKVSITRLSNEKLGFDKSHIDLNYKNFTVGVGKVNRHWSFSETTSLILSSNARPSNSAYFKLNHTSGDKIFKLIGPWSIETFNSITSNNDAPKNSMLLGIRAVIEPIYNLKFELLKTSQWGGSGQKNGISSLGAAIMGNSNENSHSNINQMAGFGFSLLTNTKKIPTRLYGQFIGEDEAGWLPTCFIYLLGTEMNIPKVSLPTKIGVEFIDTRVDTSDEKNCGPNTAYNNNTYKYTNYGKSMGAYIDTEGKSLRLWGSTRISSKININYSYNDLLINSSGWDKHRLSETQQHGSITSVGLSWLGKAYKFNSDISYENLYLGKINTLGGLKINISATYNFH